MQESRDRESAEGLGYSVRIVAPAGEFGVLNCEGLSEFNHSVVSSCVAISSCVDILTALACLRVVVSLFVLAALLQSAFSQTETHMHGEKVRHRIASREERASSVVAPRPLSGSPCLQETGRVA